MKTCSTPSLTPELIQRVGESWVVVPDDRPGVDEEIPAAYYLDGTYHTDCGVQNGCHVESCDSLPEDPGDPNNPGWLTMGVVEYDRVGDVEGRACLADGGTAPDNFGDAGNDAGVRLVPDIQSRMPAGPLGVRLYYFRDQRCEGTPSSIDIAVE